MSTWTWAMRYVISLGLFTARFRTSLPVNLKVFWKWPNLRSIFSVLPMERKENIITFVGINTLKWIQCVSGTKIMWKKCLLWDIYNMVTSLIQNCLFRATNPKWNPNLRITACGHSQVLSEMMKNVASTSFHDSIPFWLTVTVTTNIFITGVIQLRGKFKLQP